MKKRNRPPERVAVLNDRTFRAGLTIGAVLAAADPPVPASTWARWVAGKPYTEALFARVEQTLDRLIEEETNG